MAEAELTLSSQCEIEDIKKKYLKINWNIINSKSIKDAYFFACKQHAKDTKQDFEYLFLQKLETFGNFKVNDII